MKDERIETVQKWIKGEKHRTIKKIKPGESIGICGGQSGTGTSFSPPSISVFPCQFHSAVSPLHGKMKKTDHLSLHLHHRVAQ
jgi:hypothetical protein